MFPLQFRGLTATNKAMIRPHLRAGLRIYPFPYADNGFVPHRRPGERQIDWEKSVGSHPGTGASLLHLDWNKQMGQPSGQWVASIKAFPPREGSGKLPAGAVDFEAGDILDGDWIDIAVLRNGIRIPVCRGVVDSCRRGTVSAGGTTATVWNLTGRDHGAFFEYPVTWSSYWSRTMSELVAGFMTEKVNGKVGGRPDELFATLIKAWFGGKFNKGAGAWGIPPALVDRLGGDLVGVGSRLIDLLNIVPFNATRTKEGLRGAYYNELQMWTAGEQSLHQTLAQWTNPVLNEFWYDLLLPSQFVPTNELSAFLTAPPGVDAQQLAFSDEESRDNRPPEIVRDDLGLGGQRELIGQDERFGTMAAIIRERPFPTTLAGKDSMWFGLPTWHVPAWLIQQSDIGWSGHDRGNLFELQADFALGTGEEQAAAAQPRWHEEGLFTHGLRVHSETTRFFSDKDASPAAWYDERRTWLALLTDWYAGNPFWRQGSITFKTLLPEIRIGQRIVVHFRDGAEEQFYIEGVSLAYNGPSVNAGASGSTTVLVTRGFRGSDSELLDAVKRLNNKFKSVF